MNKRLFYSLAALSALSFIGHMIVYPSLPESIPVHWDANWQVNGYASKGTMIFIALLPLALLLLMRVIPKIDPRRRNYEKYGNAYSVVTAVICLLMICLTWLSAAIALGAELNMQLLLPLALGAAFLALGNFMPQFRQSYFLGIRTPWTLASAEVWRRTHRLGGALFCLLGIVIGATAFWPVGGVAVGAVFAVVIALFLYSYIVFKNLEKAHPDQTDDEKEDIQ